jgi:hypothetical protein
MNFVDLVEDLRIECGVSGSPLITVQNLNGELARLRKWTLDAWNMIQLKHQDWKFLRSTFSFQTTAGKQSYTPTEAGVPLLDLWQQDSFWMYQTSRGVVDQMPLGAMEWEHFRRMYLMGAQAQMRPMAFTVDPSKTLWFGSIPDSAYTITGEYWRDPQTLALDADTPLMPAKFHKLIVLEAMKRYAGYEAAAEVMTRASAEANPLWNALTIDQLPQVTIAGGFDGHF